MESEHPWYEAAFGRNYLELYPHRDLAAARAEVEGLIARGVRGRTLDLGCGPGRHALALRERGIDVVGLDRSAELLDVARSLGASGGARGALSGRLVRGDFRFVPFAAGAFDAVLMLFSSFGYFGDDDNARVLAGAARVLAPGGVLVLDLMNPDRVRATLVPESRVEREGRVFEERRYLVERGRRVQKDVCVIEPDGTQRAWREDVRLYGPAELEELLARAGLELLRLEGDFDGRAHSPSTPRLIAWTTRADLRKDG